MPGAMFHFEPGLRVLGVAVPGAEICPCVPTRTMPVKTSEWNPYKEIDMSRDLKLRTCLRLSFGLHLVAAAMLVSPTCLAEDPPPSSTGSNTAPGVVGFRLDDIQNGWCEAQQQVVINLFLSKSPIVPLTIGIIGNRFEPAYGTGMTTFLTSSTVQSAINAGLIEVANHGYSHPDGGMTAADGWTENTVETDLEKCAAIIQFNGILDAAPVVFIAPENNYDATTESGVASAGILTMSAQCDVNPGGNVAYCPGTGAEDIKAPNLKDPAGINQVAAGAVVDSWTDFQADVDLDAAKAWAQRQYDRQGFAVFMLHPQEFSEDNCRTIDVDQEKLNALGALLDGYRQSGARLETLSGIVKVVSGT